MSMYSGFTGFAGVGGLGQSWTVDTSTGTTSGTVTFYGAQFQTYTNTQPYVIYTQNDYYSRLAELQSLENRQRELAYLERQIDAKLEELRSLDREGLLKEMLIITEQQLDSLRSAPRYEAPKEVVVDKRQMELPLELASDTLPF